MGVNIAFTTMVVVEFGSKKTLKYGRNQLWLKNDFSDKTSVQL